MARAAKQRTPAGDLGMGLVFAGAILMILVLAFGTSKLVPFAAFLILVGLVVAISKRRPNEQGVEEATEVPEAADSD